MLKFFLLSWTQIYYHFLYLRQQCTVHQTNSELYIKVNSRLVADSKFQIRISKLLFSQSSLYLFSSALQRFPLLLLFSAQLQLSKFQFYRTSNRRCLCTCLSPMLQLNHPLLKRQEYNNCVLNSLSPRSNPIHNSHCNYIIYW